MALRAKDVKKLICFRKGGNGLELSVSYGRRGGRWINGQPPVENSAERYLIEKKGTT